MRRFSNTILPAYRELIYGPNPLLTPEWGPEITQQEGYLIMEFIDGRGLDQVIGEFHDTADGDFGQLERVALVVAESVLELCEVLYENGAGSYTRTFGPTISCLQMPPIGCG